MRAFSLVELSIVLVILGLLTGGILAGQSLIRAAELRSVTNDMARYQTALFSFRDKYMALPGDMRNATNFWTSAGGNGQDDTCFGSTTASPATCNGNGNGLIDAGYSTNVVSEPLRAWQQLANAGLIEGSYNGIVTGTAHILGTNCPRGRISNTGFALSASAFGGNWGETFSAASDGNILFFGTMDGAITRGVALRPQEAWNIDTKLDDGKPDQGKLQTDTFYSVNCFTGTYPNAAYAVGTNNIACSLRFQLMK